MKTFKKSFAKRAISAVLATAMVSGIFAGTGVSINAKAADLSALAETVNGGSVKTLSDFIDGAHAYDRNYIFSSNSIVNGTDLVTYDKATSINDKASYYSDEGELTASQIKRDEDADRGSATNPFVLTEVVPNELKGVFFESINGAFMFNYNQMGIRFSMDSADQVKKVMTPETTGIEYQMIGKTSDFYFFSEEDVKAAENYLKALGKSPSHEKIVNDVIAEGEFEGSSGKYMLEKDGVQYFADDATGYDAYGNYYQSWYNGKTAYEYVTYKEESGVYKATSGNYLGKDVTSLISGKDGSGNPIVYVKNKWNPNPFNLDSANGQYKDKTTATAELADQYSAYYGSEDYILLSYVIDEASNKNDIYKYHKFTGVPQTAQWYGYFYEAEHLEEIEIDGVKRLCATDGNGHIAEISSDGKRYSKDCVELSSGKVIWVGLDYYSIYNQDGSLKLDDLPNEEIFWAACQTGITSQYTHALSGTTVSKMKKYAIRTSPLYLLKAGDQFYYTAMHQTDYFKKYAIGQVYGAPTPKKDENGNVQYETDDDGNYILGEDGKPVEALNKDRTTWTWSESDTATLKSVVLKIDKYHVDVIVTTPEDLNNNLSIIGNTDLILMNDWVTSRATISSLYGFIDENHVDYNESGKKKSAYYNDTTDKANFQVNDLSWKAVKLIVYYHFLDQLPVMISQMTPYRSNVGSEVAPAPGIDLSVAGKQVSSEWGNYGIGTGKTVKTNYDKMFTILTSMESEDFMDLWWNRLKEDVLTSSKILYKDGKVRYNTTGYLDTRRDTTSSDTTGLLQDWGYNNLIPYYKLATSYDSTAELQAAILALVNKYGILVQSDYLTFAKGSVSTEWAGANDIPMRVTDYVYTVPHDNDSATQMTTYDENSQNGNFGDVYGWFEEQGDSDLNGTVRSSDRSSKLAIETIFYYLINATGQRNRYNEAIGDLNVLEVEAEDVYMSDTEWTDLLNNYFGAYRNSSAKTTISRVNINELASFSIDEFVKYDMIYFGGKGHYITDDADLTEKNVQDIIEYAIYRPVIFGGELFDVQNGEYTKTKYLVQNQIDTRQIAANEENITDNLKDAENLYEDLFCQTLVSKPKTSLTLDPVYTHEEHGKVKVNVYNDIVLLGKLKNYHMYETFLQTYLDNKVYRIETATPTLSAGNPESGVNSRLTVSFTGKASTTAETSAITSKKFVPVLYIDSNYDGYYDKEDEYSYFGGAFTGKDPASVISKDNTKLNKMTGAINYLVEIRVGSKTGVVVDSWQGVVKKLDTELGITVLEITKKGSQTEVKSGFSASAIDLNSQRAVFENVPDIKVKEGDTYVITYDSASSDMIADGTVNLTDYDAVVIGLKDDFDSEADVASYIDVIKTYAESSPVIVGKGAVKTKAFAEFVGIDTSIGTGNPPSATANNILNAYSTDNLEIKDVGYSLSGSTGGSNYIGYKLEHAFQAERSNITEWPYKIDDAAVITGATNSVPMYAIEDVSKVGRIDYFTPYYTLNSNYDAPAKADYKINDALDLYYAYAFSSTESDGSTYSAYYTGISNSPSEDEAKIFTNMIIGGVISSLVVLDINIDNTNKTVTDENNTYLYYTSDAGDPENIQVITNDATEDTANMSNDTFAVTTGGTTTYYKRVYFTMTNAAAEGGAFLTNFYTYRKTADPFNKANSLAMTNDVYTKVFEAAAGSELDAANLKNAPKIYVCRADGSRALEATYGTVNINGKSYTGYQLLAGKMYCYDMKLTDVELYGVKTDSILEPYVGIVGLYIPTDSTSSLLPSKAKPDNNKHYVYMNVKALASSLFHLD